MRVPLALLAAALLVVPLGRGAEHHLGGALRYDGTPLVVGPGDVLVLDPGTVVTGNASIQIQGGVLRALGAPGDAVQITIPIALDAGEAWFENARIWGIAGTALTQRGGNLTLRSVTFEGNGVGLAALGDAGARLDADGATFRSHATLAMRLQGGENASIARSAFAQNGQHLRIDAGDVRVESSDFGAVVAGGGAPLPGVLVRSDLPSAAVVTLSRNEFHDGDVGLRVEGAGARVDSRGDAFRANRVGVSVAGARVDLVRDAFDKEDDVERDAASSVTLVEPTFARATATAAWPAWLVPAAVALVVGAAGGAYAWSRRGRAPPPEPPKPAFDLGAPLRPMERRILADLAAHPGSAQSAAAQRLGLTRQALHYHVKKLAARGLVRKEVRGRETLCTVPPGVAEALAAQESTNTPEGVAPP